MSATGAHVRGVAGALRWRVDPARSELALAGATMGAPWVDGLLRGLRGSLVLDLEQPTGSGFELAGAACGLYVGDPFLNSRLRLADVLGEGEVRLSGTLACGVLPGEYEATVSHNLEGLRSPLQMAVELWQWEVRPAGRTGGADPTARISVSARQLEGLERLELHLEAVLEADEAG
jgi:hypothetical protein